MADSRRHDTGGEDDHEPSPCPVFRAHTPDELQWSDDEQQVREDIGYANRLVH